MTGVEALIAAQAVAAIGGGIASSFAANKEAKALESQAALAQQESRFTAQQKAREVSNFRAKQGINYMASGVTLEGTPLQKMEETRRLGQQEVDAMMRRGQAQSDLLMQRGRAQRNAGRAAMLGSILKAGTSAAGTLYSAGRIPSTSSWQQTSPGFFDPVSAIYGG